MPPPQRSIGHIETEQHLENFVRQRLDLPGNLKARVAKFGTDITALETAVAALTTRMGTAEGAITGLDTRLDTAEANITTAEGRLDTLDFTLGDVEARVGELENQPQVHAYRTTDFTVARGTNPLTDAVAVPFGSERYDLPDNDQHSNSTNTERLTARKTRLSLVMGAAVWEPISAAGGVRRVLFLRRNGTELLAKAEFSPTISATSELTFVVSKPIRMTPNDYVELLAFHDHPTIDLKLLYKDDYSPWLAMTSLGKTT